jgi:hypothetical protein
VEEGARAGVRLALLGLEDPTGQFFDQEEPSHGDNRVD